MDLVAIFLSGLGGAIVGSALTYIGAFAIDRSQRREAKRGAARALYHEVVQNQVYGAQMADDEAPVRHLSTDTWAATRIQIANYIKPYKFHDVATAYFMLDAFGTNIETILQGRQRTAQDNEMMAEVAHRFGIASNALLTVAYNKRGRRELERELETQEPAGPGAGGT